MPDLPEKHWLHSALSFGKCNFNPSALKAGSANLRGYLYSGPMLPCVPKRDPSKEISSAIFRMDAVFRSPNHVNMLILHWRACFK